MDLHPDFRDLLAEFARENVSYAVIGGYAVGHHAKPRATKDLDILVSASGDNLDRVARALENFGAPPNLVAAAKKLGEMEVIYLGSHHQQASRRPPAGTRRRGAARAASQSEVTRARVDVGTAIGPTSTTSSSGA